MVINVYDNNCQAAVGVDPMVTDDGDFNSDRRTDIEDLILMAVKRLSESTITEPGIKPQP